MVNKPKPLKRSLADMLAKADDAREGRAVEPEAQAAPMPEPAAARPAPRVVAAPEPEPGRPVSVQFFLAEKDRDRLKRVGLDTRMSLNAICHEALSAWLEARGLPPLEWTSANFPSGRRPKG